MSSLARSLGRKPPKPAGKPKRPAPVAMMSEAERKALRARFLVIAAITLACCAGAYAGMLGTVRHLWWGLPLFVLAMIVGFGTQIVFIVGLVKANRTDKGA